MPFPTILVISGFNENNFITEYAGMIRFIYI